MQEPDPHAGYSREQFGDSWAEDSDGCSTRDDVLARDLTDVKRQHCVVESGTLADPYSGKVIDFHRGKDTSKAVEIDHIVALSNAWATGAQQLDANKREELANDPDNLVAVDGPTNEDKSDADASGWLPADAYRCTYVKRQVIVKARYQLWLTPDEHNAIGQQLIECSHEEGNQ